MIRKRFKVSGKLKEWITRPGNYYEKIHNGGYVLLAGYFSGDDIPEDLQQLLRRMYDEFDKTPVELEFISS